jgi:hypothetical protein
MTSDSGTSDQSHKSLRSGSAIQRRDSATSHAFIDFHPYQEVVPSAGKLSTATSDKPPCWSSWPQRWAEASKFGKVKTRSRRFCSAACDNARVPLKRPRNRL